jgi:hypothetical protein
MRILAQMFEPIGISYLPPTPSVVGLFGHCSPGLRQFSYGKLKLLSQCKGIFFFSDKSPLVVAPNLMPELHTTKD